jgi:hypothetical protein
MLPRSIPAIVLADHSRERRTGLQRALRRAGHVPVTTGSGTRALRLVRAHAPPLLIAHVGVRCGDEPMERILRRERSSFCSTRVLWFANQRTPRHEIHRHSRFASCASGFDTVTAVVEEMLNGGGAPRQPRGLLGRLMALDEALGELSDWSL